MKPLLLLDVDGPLNPWDGTNKPRQRAGYRKYNMNPLGWDGYRTLGVWLNAAHGPALRDLAQTSDLELVWATSWNHEANRLIAPRIGLPRLPVIEFDTTDPTWETDWKYPAITAYAAGRPLAWLDDDFAMLPDKHAAFIADRASLPTLDHHVSPVTGITDTDLHAIRTWAATLTL